MATLGYWNIRGLADPIRYLLHHVGADFEDKRYEVGPAPKFDESSWLNEKYKLGLDFPNLPYYIDGNLKLTQSTAIIRHLARKYNLTPENEVQMVRADMAEQEASDLRLSLVHVCYSGPRYESQREQYLKSLPTQLQLFDKFLDGNRYVAGDKLTYVDFIVYDALDIQEHFEPNSLASYSNINPYLERIRGLPGVDKYMKSDNYHPSRLCRPNAAFLGH